MLHMVAGLLVTHLVEFVMLSVGLKARPSQVLREVQRPALLVRELLVLALGVPLLTLFVVRLFAVPRWTATVAILFGISPAAPFLLRSFQRRESAAAKALAVVAIALCASVFLVPLWLVLLNRFFDFELRVSPLEILGMLAPKVFAPLLAGVLLARHAPRAARALDRALTFVIIVALVIACILLVQLGGGTLRLITVPIVLALLLVSFGSALLGELAGGRDPELREILGRVAMTGNPAIALAVIGTSYPELDLGGLVAAYLICRAVAAIPYTLLARHRLLRSRHVEPST